MAKLSKEQVESIFVDLINSTVEGQTGEWDCSTDEGRESFGAMRTQLEELAEHFEITFKEGVIKEVEKEDEDEED